MKLRIKPMLGFKVFDRAAVTIAGVELLHRIRKGQFNLGRLRTGGQARPRFGTRCFRPDRSNARSKVFGCAKSSHQSPFEQSHDRHALPDALEIPMEPFTRAVEIVLKDSALHDAPGWQRDPGLWAMAVRSSGCIQSRQAISNSLTTMVA